MIKGIEAVLDRMTGVKRLPSGAYQAHCPAHDDRRASLSITQAGDKILMNCHAGCRTEAILGVMGLEMEDLFIEEKKPRQEPKVVTTYDYTDEAGVLLFQVVRTDPKGFFQRHKNGGGEWLNRMDGVRRVIYHLPEVLAGDKVFNVEGEKDADGLRLHGLTATTSPGGANAWKAEYADCFKDKDVTVIPDNDEPGYEYARQVVKSIKGTAKSIKAIILPEGSKDVSEWLDRGGDINQLEALEQDVTVLFGMRKAEVKETTGGYDFEWSKQQVKVECRRLALHSGELKGEITILHAGQHIYQASFNFSSGQSRDRLSCSLKKKLDVSWAEMFEQVCTETLERFRKGEIVVELSSINENVKPPEYLLRPFIIKNYPTIIFGDPSSSKSLNALIMTICMVLPWYDNPMGWDAPQRPIRCLYLDWETDSQTVEWALSCVSKGMGLGPLCVNYRRCSHPLATDVEQIAKWIDETGAEFTIIDSLGMAAGGDLNATEPAFNFWAAWRKLKTTSLILAHTSKNSDDKRTRSVYGNQYYSAEARCIWEVKKSQENDSSEMDVALFNRKPPPFAKLHGPLGLHINFQGGDISDKTIITRGQPQSVSEFVAAMGTQAEIEQLIKENTKMTNAQIQEALTLSPDNIRHALKRLKDKQKIIKLDDGSWGLNYRV